MKIPLSPVLPISLLMTLAMPVLAQNQGNVEPATLPLPLQSTAPVSPDVLRARNPFNLPVTGNWKFKLTHGRIVDGQFQSQDADSLNASSVEGPNPTQNAFDGDEATRWCASNGDFPQFLEADLGKVEHVGSIGISWEEPDAKYRYVVAGRKENKGAWTTLADASAAPGVSNGPIIITPADVRYVRVTVSAATDGKWASIREFKIGLQQNGQLVNWRTPSSKTNQDTPAVRDAFAAPGFADKAWDNIAVPSNWEMLGYSIPTYNTVDNTVGLYRRSIDIPANWSGKRVYWHFDGALDGAEIFVNGQKAGYHESGYTAFQVDVTDFLKPGQRNSLAVRVSKTTPSFEADTGDYQSMGGIYRDTSLIAVPQTHVHDITVRTPLSADYRDATLNTDVQVSGKPGDAVTVAGSLVSADGNATGVKLTGTGNVGTDGTATVSLSAPVTAPKLWSAEKPNLYYVVLELSSGGKPVERVEQRFGFKQIDVKNNVVLWNGVPIKCTGICRHDFWSDKGFALTDVEWNKDLDMMKGANINAVRTSHYNHAARFLELCDEKGMYILDEVPYCWIGDSTKDLAFLPYLQLRARETVARDKNKPCVLAWSLGNENPMGQDSQLVLTQVKASDPTRPAFVSGQNPESVKGEDWRDDHYPGPDSVNRDTDQTKVRWPTNYTEHPHTFYEQDAQEYDPGISDLWSETLLKTWSKLWPAPNMLGSFIWEWQSQGVADKNEDKTREFYEGPNHLRQENNKGIVDGYRHPKPELWIVKMAYSKIVVDARTVKPVGTACTVPLTNHYSFTDLNELSCKWTALKGKTALKSGTVRVSCAPLQNIDATFPAVAGMTELRLEFLDAKGSSVYAADLPVEGNPLTPAPAAQAAGGALDVQAATGTLRVANAAQELLFNRSSGAIQSWKVGGKTVLTGGAVLNLGEGKNGRDGDQRDYLKGPNPPVTRDAKVVWIPGKDGATLVTVTSSVLDGNTGAALGSLTVTYNVQTDAEIGVDWKLDWSAGDKRLWECGLKLPVSSDLSTMRWQRDSYFLDYPAGHLGEPEGSCKAGDVSFRASKRGIHWMTLTNAAGSGIALLPDGGPLISRALPGTASNLLLASSGVAGVRGLSGSWVDDHGIDAKKDKPLAGSFTLRAIGGAAR